MSIGFKVEELHDQSCPECGKGMLRRVVINSQPAAYYCIARKFGDDNCKLKFDVQRLENTDDEGWVVHGQAENPKYVEKLNSASLEENLSISVQLEQQGVSFFLEKDYTLETLSRAEIQGLKDAPKK